MKDSINIRVAGLGGMGVLKATLILGEMFFELGFDVKKAEVHGMAQRGGSVSSDLRVGKRVLSPMIPDGKIDYLLSLQPEWSDAYKAFLAPGGIVVSPEDFDVSKLPSRKSVNVAILGALSRHFPEIPESKWRETLRKFFPEKLWEANEAAFALGRGATPAA